MAIQIQSLLEGMDDQISERTKDLERRAVELQTASEVARDASSARDIDSLLSNAVELISQRFGFYHAGIFLLDEKGEFAELRATNSEGGKQMLDLGHKLKVGEVGIVGDTTFTGRPHIALDVGVDAAHFENPYLPDTRSEMALPLTVGDDIIGALDVQSKEEGAFDQEDITILQVLADQLAIAIQNSQLLNEVQETVEELQTAYGDFTRRSWSAWSRGIHARGYQFSGAQVEPVTDQPPEVENVWKNDKAVKVTKESQSTLAIPLKLRDITLGVINLQVDGDQIPEEFENLINDISERLALAIENARLLETTQQRAAQEQLVSELTSRMRETLDVDTVLKTAVKEIRGALELQDLTIQLEPKPTLAHHE
jgi:GAF domain-containing protein